MLEFGALLRVYRTHWDLTQREMAELLCLSQPVYSRIETGRKPVSLKTLQRVADRSKIPIQTLILAHLLLDENLAAILAGRQDQATRALLEFVEARRRRAPEGVRNGAALALLFESAAA